ncbi:MAG: hypothetical protein JXN62_08025 [Bacteroidales bacterium]|nr:hypothetical protein [Bacteroidales bacterium]
MLRTILTLFTIVSYTAAWTQDLLVINKITGPITFDGVPDEIIWQAIPDLNMVMYSPVFGNEQEEKATVKIAYDDEFLYVSGILRYRNQEDIRAVGKKRDLSDPSTDWFGFILDTFNDKQNAMSFWTTPNGLRTDATVMNDLAYGQSDINFSWNTFWDVKTAIGDRQWSAEMRIPLSSLRFQNIDGKTRMGITICQFCAATSELYTFPVMNPKFSDAYWKPSLASVIEFTGLNPKKPLYVTPYITAGVGLANELNEGGNEYNMNPTFRYDAGFDVKYSITNNLTADITVNTDFAQVEADDQKINLTRYSLYFPEKRNFFQEKSDIFNFSFLGDNNLFYSRRIGIYSGSPVRIYGGARITGRINRWDVGFMDMQTAPIEDNPGENLGVMRVKRTVFNENSYAGGMLTSRLGMNGDYNLTYGIDGQFRVKGDEYLTIRYAQTFENDSMYPFLNLAPCRMLLNWEHRNQEGIGYDLVYTYSGSQFNPGVGFEELDNYQGIRGLIQYGWFPEEKKPIYYHRIYFSSANIWNTATGLQQTASASLSWYFQAKKGFYGSAGLNWYQEDIADSLIIANAQASIPPGRYRYLNMSAIYGTSSSHAVSSYFLMTAGRYYDGWNVSLYALPSINIGTGLSAGLSYNLDYVNFPDRSMKFTNHILGIKGLMTLTTKTSLAAFFQYNTAVNKIYSNIRFRFNPREGNDLYLVYDEGLNTKLTRETPYLPLSSGRTILLKYTYTFRF